jgi:hypothetical protein
VQAEASYGGTMTDQQLTTLTGILVGLQFAAFGWRVNREINVSDGDRKQWLPLPDILNIVSLMSVVAVCVVVPLARGEYGVWSLRVLAGAATLIAFHPWQRRPILRRKVCADRGTDYGCLVAGIGSSRDVAGEPVSA